MKRILSAFLLTLSLSTQAGLPPTTLSGQDSATKPTTFNFKTPYNQATKISGTESLIETGNANVLADPGAEATTTPWSAYKDAAGVLPVDGTAGTALYVTCANSATAPLAGTKSFLITKTANNAQGEGCSIPFTISTSSIYKVNRLSFDYAIASGTYTDDEVEWFVYDVTNGGAPKPFTPSKLKNHSLPSETFAPNGEFQASDSTSYRLIAHIAGTSASAYSLKFDNFKLGVFEKTYGKGDTEYSAQVTTTSGAHSGENRDFISSCTAANPTVCTFTASAGFTVNPNCSVSIAATTGTTAVEWSAISSTSISVTSYNTSTGANVANQQFTLNCQKSGTDYTNASGLVMSNDADTRVVAAYAIKNGTQVLSGTVTNVASWTVSNDTHGAMSTTGTYTIPSSGWYEFGGKYTISLPSGTYGNLVNIASAGLDFIGNYVAGDRVGSSTIRYMLAGQTLVPGIYSSGSTGTVTTASDWWVKKISGPSQIAASESVSALYTGAPPTGTLNSSYNIITFGTKVKDSHNAYSGGSYTVPSNGIYDISSSVTVNGTYAINTSAAVAVFIDGVAKHENYTYAGGAQSVLQGNVDVKSIPLLAGQVVTIRVAANSTSPTFSSTASINRFSIVRTGSY